MNEPLIVWASIIVLVNNPCTRQRSIYCQSWNVDFQDWNVRGSWICATIDDFIHYEIINLAPLRIITLWR